MLFVMLLELIPLPALTLPLGETFAHAFGGSPPAILASVTAPSPICEESTGKFFLSCFLSCFFACFLASFLTFFVSLLLRDVVATSATADPARSPGQ